MDRMSRISYQRDSACFACSRFHVPAYLHVIFPWPRSPRIRMPLLPKYTCILVYKSTSNKNPGAVHAASRVFRFCPMIFLLNDRPGGARTHDLMIKSHLLCQLSYGPEHRRYSNTKTKAVAIENSRSSTVFFWFFVCVSGITLPIPPSPIMGMLAKAKFF